MATARKTAAEQAAAEIHIPDPSDVITLDPDYDPALSEVTRPSDLGFGKAREVIVEPLRDPPPVYSDDGWMEVRMAETIEEFTYGNPHYMVKLEAGKRYRVPVHIGRYLMDLGKVYQRA